MSDSFHSLRISSYLVSLSISQCHVTRIRLPELVLLQKLFIIDCHVAVFKTSLLPSLQSASFLQNPKLTSIFLDSPNLETLDVRFSSNIAEIKGSWKSLLNLNRAGAASIVFSLIEKSYESLEIAPIAAKFRRERSSLKLHYEQLLSEAKLVQKSQPSFFPDADSVSNSYPKSFEFLFRHNRFTSLMEDMLDRHEEALVERNETARPSALRFNLPLPLSSLAVKRAAIVIQRLWKFKKKWRESMMMIYPESVSDSIEDSEDSLNKNVLLVPLNHITERIAPAVKAEAILEIPPVQSSRPEIKPSVLNYALKSKKNVRQISQKQPAPKLPKAQESVAAYFSNRSSKSSQ